MAQAGGGGLVGPGGVTAIDCAPALFAPRARRLPASGPRARTPALRTALGPRDPAYLLDSLLCDFPFASRPGGREGHRHGRGVNSTLGYLGFFSRCARQPKMFILCSRWGLGAQGRRRGLVRPTAPPRRLRAHRRATTRTASSQDPARASPPGDRPRPTPRPARRRPAVPRPWSPVVGPGPAPARARPPDAADAP